MARLVLGLIVGVALAGCINSNLIDCGDRACPGGSVCVPTGCAAPDQVTVCNGLVDGTECDTKEFTGGACLGGVCLQIICGDGIVVPPEVCDDGNQLSGDGCSSDCRSTETCGNGIVDGTTGEQCDNLPAGLSHDGCSSTCGAEFEVWIDVSPLAPPFDSAAAMGYDAKRGRTVMFTSSGETWEWDGVVWRHYQPAVTPTPRQGAGLAYDPVHDQLLLVGGQVAQITTRAETWQWDGLSWTQIVNSAAVESGSPALAFDSAHQALILLAGGTTWGWNGSVWHILAGASPPMGRVMAFDPSGNTLIAFDPNGVTWTFDGTAWTQLLTPTHPSARSGMAMTSDAQGILLYGGMPGGSETWRWKNGLWSQLSPPKDPGSLFGAAMAFDSARDRIVLYGGAATPNTYEWDGTTWQNIAYQLAPAALHDAGAIYQPATGRILLFGGQNLVLSSPTSETWQWDGVAWVPDVYGGTDQVPPGRRAFGIVATPAGALMFGGLGSGGSSGTPLADTWRWDGRQWLVQQPAHAPPARGQLAMSYDSGRAVTVVFGGETTTGPLGDTWEYDGTDWAERLPAHQPPVRGGAVMGYDPARGKTTLFGGEDANNQSLNDTWEWDGTDWAELTPAVSPPARLDAAAAYDASRGTLVVFGGFANTKLGTLLSDLWEWDGTTWRQSAVVQGPPAQSGPALAYDPIAGQLVLFDDQGTTHAHRWTAPIDPADQCLGPDSDGDGLAGCADPDCWARCTPWCPPHATCDPTTPHCGDGVCSEVEDYDICPTDCAP